jgi:hypothetical protein
LSSLFNFESFGQYVEGDGEKADTVQKQENKPEEPEKGPFSTDRLVPGGNFALNFGNPYYYDLSPFLGYMVNKKLMAGVGVTYIAFGENFNGVKYKETFYGGRVLGRYRLFDSFYANAEMDALNVSYFTGNMYETARIWTYNPLIGASYIMPFGKRGGIQATLYYNLNYKELYSPYSSPFIWRIGFFL